MYILRQMVQIESRPTLNIAAFRDNFTANQ
jgi:hypothetical protein